MEPAHIFWLVAILGTPIAMIAGAIWFVSWYAQNKVRRDIQRDRQRRE